MWTHKFPTEKTTHSRGSHPSLPRARTELSSSTLPRFQSRASGISQEGWRRKRVEKRKFTYIKKNFFSRVYVAPTTTNTKFLFLVDVHSTREEWGKFGVRVDEGGRRTEFLFIRFNFCIPVSQPMINRFQWKLFCCSGAR